MIGIDTANRSGGESPAVTSIQKDWKGARVEDAEIGRDPGLTVDNLPKVLQTLEAVECFVERRDVTGELTSEMGKIGNRMNRLIADVDCPWWWRQIIEKMLYFCLGTLDGKTKGDASSPRTSRASVIVSKNNSRRCWKGI